MNCYNIVGLDKILILTSIVSIYSSSLRSESSAKGGEFDGLVLILECILCGEASLEARNYNSL